jgi:hypothetical protein
MISDEAGGAPRGDFHKVRRRVYRAVEAGQAEPHSGDHHVSRVLLGCLLSCDIAHDLVLSLALKNRRKRLRAGFAAESSAPNVNGSMGGYKGCGVGKRVNSALMRKYMIICHGTT